MSKFKIIVACILILLSFSACAKGNPNPETSNEEDVVNETEKKPVTKDDYLNALYGYYDSDGYYFYIAEDSFEKKNKADGTLVVSGMVNEINVQMADDGVIFDIIFYRDSYNPISMYCNSVGVITDEYNNNYVEISQKEYDSIAPKPNDYGEYDSDPDNYGQVQNEVELPWYQELFDKYTLQSDLQYIDNLLAVGKESEALSVIEEKLFKKIDLKVDELIKKREYWVAHNYVAMHNAHLSGTHTDICGSYPFVEDFFKEKYTSDDAIYGISRRGFSDFTQKYYLKIIQAKKADGDYISKEDSLYKLNEYFLQNGFQTRTGLWDTYYMYYTDNFDQNFETTEYYIVCPYTKQIQYIPADYYYMDIDLFYEGVLGEYM